MNSGDIKSIPLVVLTERVGMFIIEHRTSCESFKIESMQIGVTAGPAHSV